MECNEIKLSNETGVGLDQRSIQREPLSLKKTLRQMAMLCELRVSLLLDELFGSQGRKELLDQEAGFGNPVVKSLENETCSGAGPDPE